MSPYSTCGLIFDPPPVPSSPPVTAGPAGSFILTDVDHLAVVFPSWDMMFVQLDPGHFCASAGCIQGAGVLNRRVQTDRKIQVRGIPHGSRLVFTLITEANECWLFQGGQRLRPGEIKIHHPGEARDEIYEAGSEGQSLEIDEAMLREVLAIKFQKELDEVLPRGTAIRPTSQAFSTFQSRLGQSVRLDAARQPEHADRDIAAQVMDSYLDAICSLLVNGVREVKPACPRGGRLDLARDAEKIMDSFPHRPLPTAHLCQHLCVSRRSLFYAFQDVFGMSPIAYYKAKRLALVRSELKVLDPASTTVRMVALRMGFQHAGQFARDYYLHYGERPSETLLKGLCPSRCRSRRSDRALAEELVASPV